MSLFNIRNSKTPINLVTLAFFAHGTSAYSQTASFSEPEVIFYGQVCANEGPANCTILTSGTMEWTLTPPTGDPVVISTELAAHPNGISYVLRIPAESLVTGTEISPNSLSTGAASISYNRGNVTVGGTAYLISVPNGNEKNTLSYSTAERGHIERVDLALTIVSFPDSDGDGMSDAFENLYAADGLNPNDSSDALGDIDGDGVTNLGEFQAGTDPNGFDYNTWAALPGSGLALSEREKTFDKEDDGMNNWFEFAIGAQPSVSDISFANAVIQSSFVTEGSDEHFTLTFTKPSARRLGVVYAIEQNDNLTGQWQRVADGALVPLEDSRTTLEARETNPAISKGFLRLATDES